MSLPSELMSKRSGLRGCSDCSSGKLGARRGSRPGDAGPLARTGSGAGDAGFGAAAAHAPGAMPGIAGGVSRAAWL